MWIARYTNLAARRVLKFDLSRSFQTSIHASVDWRKVRLGNATANKPSEEGEGKAGGSSQPPPQPQRSSQEVPKTRPTMREHLFPPLVIEPPVILSKEPPPGGYAGPKPPPIPLETDPRPSEPPRHWYQRLEIVLPAFIALAVVLRALIDVYGDVFQQQRPLAQKSASPAKDASSTATSSARTLEVQHESSARSVAMAKAKLVSNEKATAKAQDKAQVMTRGEMQLGGSWTLLGPTGERVTDADLRGSWLLLYFGFTQCPDICPEQLERNVQVVEAVERASGGAVRLRPVMVTLDPERDTPPVLARYCASYSPRLLGLTGTDEEIIACKKLYYVFSEVGQSDPNGDYLLDHSIISYLVDPSGRCIDFYGRFKSADDMCRLILRHAQHWNEAHPPNTGTNSSSLLQ